MAIIPDHLCVAQKIISALLFDSGHDVNGWEPLIPFDNDPGPDYTPQCGVSVGNCINCGGTVFINYPNKCVMDDILKKPCLKKRQY